MHFVEGSKKQKNWRCNNILWGTYILRVCFRFPRVLLLLYTQLIAFVMKPIYIHTHNVTVDQIWKACLMIFSSPEPKAHRWAHRILMVRHPSVRRRSQCSKIFFSETALPIKAKFYVEPPWGGGTKVYINGPGHMTKMAATPIYGKNPSKSSSPEPAGRFSRNLVCSIGDSCPS